MHQSGFDKGHCASTALLNLVEEIKQNADNNVATVSIVFDLSKAFDTLNFFAPNCTSSVLMILLNNFLSHISTIDIKSYQ